MKYVWIDQWGHAIYAKNKRELCERAGYRSGKRIYHDTKTGPACIGYVVGGRWFVRYVHAPL